MRAPAGCSRTSAIDLAAGRWFRFEDPVDTIAARDPAQVVPTLPELERRVEADGPTSAGGR